MTKHDYRYRRFFLALAAFVFSASATQSQQEISTLEPRIAIERELAGGQNHIYQFSLIKDQYASVIVEQRGIDVVVHLFRN